MPERRVRTSMVPAVDSAEGLSLSAATWQTALWGGAALAAVGLALAAAYSGGGDKRMAQVPLANQPVVVAAEPASRILESRLEARRFSEEIKQLAADRDRLQARVAALEHAREDVTGSLASAQPETARSTSPRPPASPTAAPEATADDAASRPAASNTAALPPVSSAAPTAGASSPGSLPETLQLQLRALNQGPHAAGQAPTQTEATPPIPAGPSWSKDAANIPAEDTAGSGSVATRTEFGVDVGGASTMGAVRVLWQSVHQGRDTLFQGLRPVVSVHEGARPGTVEFRLIVGPLANASATARLCGELSSAGQACQTTIFDGQRLALK